MFRLVVVLSVVIQGLCQETQQSNILGDAKQLLTSADTYVNITKRVASEFDKTIRHLERALSIFQLKDATEAPVVGQDYKDCQCNCNCPPAGADINTVEEVKGKVITLRSKLLDVAEGTTPEETVNSEEFNAYTDRMVEKGVNLYLDMLLAFVVDVVASESHALTALEEKMLLVQQREKRAPMGCVCGGHDDIQKTFSDLKDKADFVTGKIEGFNAKVRRAGRFIKDTFLHIPKAVEEGIISIKDYFKKKD